jgi:hypothetical protein
VIQIWLGADVSNDSFVGEIREKQNSTSPLIATWDVTFLTDGTDGKLVLTIDDSEANITQKSGFTDLKRISGGEPLPAFDPIPVKFIETVTA